MRFKISYLFKTLHESDWKRYAWVLSSQALKRWVESGHFNEMASHLLRGYLRISWYFLALGGKISSKWMVSGIIAKQLCGEWRFPVGWCLVVRVKWKLITWKNSWREESQMNTLRYKRFFRSHHSWKRQWTTTACFQFVICLFRKLHPQMFP